jgi:hypothetical protein
LFNELIFFLLNDEAVYSTIKQRPPIGSLFFNLPLREEHGLTRAIV